MKRIVCLIITVFITGCASGSMESSKSGSKLTPHYKDSMFKITDGGMYGVEMRIKGDEFKAGINAADLIIHDNRNRDVVGANVSVVPWMPEMGHGVSDKPVVTERGGGLYAAENITFTMAGHWELRVEIDKNNMKDSAVFDFPEIRAETAHKHHTKHDTRISGLDYSKEKLTDAGSFKVSYESDSEPVPVNRIHTWVLKVETPDGQPVTGAEISLDGDMPEHGHGLPTRPEVTMELGEGNYLVEGLKFSMPGWWVMKFSIRARDLRDSVTFNLMLK